MKSPRRFRRGQATVELAVTMLILVPTFLYVLFLDDLLKAKLDLEEAVMMAPWEYTQVDFEKGKPGSGIRSGIQRGWCDHTTAYNSYDKPYDCDEAVHHIALSAHECWLTSGAQQVACEIGGGPKGRDFGKLKGGSGSDAVHDQYTNGGLVRCSGKLGVINYSLPAKMFEEFTEVSMTRTEKKSGNVHEAGRGLAVEAHYLLEGQQAALLVDTWAMSTFVTVEPTSDGDLRQRAQTVYEALWSDASGKVDEFTQMVQQGDVASSMLVMDGMGDDVSQVNLAFDPENGAPFNEGMHGSPWEPERGDYYLGNRQPIQ